MRKQLIGLFSLVAVILAAAFVVSPKATTTNAASIQIDGIDILALTKAATDLPEQSYPTH